MNFIKIHKSTLSPSNPKEIFPPLVSATKKYPKTHPAREIEEENNTQVFGLELRLFFLFPPGGNALRKMQLQSGGD